MDACEHFFCRCSYILYHTVCYNEYRCYHRMYAKQTSVCHCAVTFHSHAVDYSSLAMIGGYRI